MTKADFRVSVAKTKYTALHRCGKVFWSEETSFTTFSALPECLTHTMKCKGPNDQFRRRVTAKLILLTDHLYPMRKHFYPNGSGLF